MHGHLAYVGTILLGAAAVACSSGNSTPSAGGNTPNPTPGSAGMGVGGSTATPLPTPTTASCPSTEVTRTPLRRLTRFEYANSVKSLLGVDATPADALPADEVTDGFSNNAAVLTVSPLHAEKYVLVSEELAKAAVKDLARLTTCDVGARGEEPCARDFANNFGRRAFRRPITAEDEQFLMTAYAAGRVDGSYAEGIEVMIRAAAPRTMVLRQGSVLRSTRPRRFAETAFLAHRTAWTFSARCCATCGSRARCSACSSCESRGR